MKAAILAGGELRPDARLRALVADVDLVVAADSGLRHAAGMGLEAQLVVGDFDSVEPALLVANDQAERIEFPVDKGSLDLELALTEALDRGAKRLVVMGAIGSRFDQSLAAVLIAMRLRRQGVELSLHDERRDVWPMTAGDSLRLPVAAGVTFSLLALETSRCTVSGARWELDDAKLEVGLGIGVSNVAGSSTSVSVREGALLLLVEHGVHGER